MDRMKIINRAYILIKCILNHWSVILIKSQYNVFLGSPDMIFVIVTWFRFVDSNVYSMMKMCTFKDKYICGYVAIWTISKCVSFNINSICAMPLLVIPIIKWYTLKGPHCKYAETFSLGHPW
jgi:hypothetical protein